MSQAQLAKALHISPSALGMYEQGRREPSIDILIMLSNLFRVSLDYLITGSEFTYNTPPGESQKCDRCPCDTCFWKEYSK